MFKRQKLYGMIPLTKSALLQCAKLAVYQAERLWGQPLINGPTRPIQKKELQKNEKTKTGSHIGHRFLLFLPVAKKHAKCGCKKLNPTGLQNVLNQISLKSIMPVYISY